MRTCSQKNIEENSRRTEASSECEPTYIDAQSPLAFDLKNAKRSWVDRPNSFRPRFKADGYQLHLPHGCSRSVKDCRLEMIFAADKRPLSALKCLGGTDAGSGGRGRLPVDPNRNLLPRKTRTALRRVCGAINSQELSCVVRGCSLP